MCLAAQESISLKQSVQAKIMPIPRRVEKTEMRKYILVVANFLTFHLYTKVHPTQRNSFTSYHKKKSAIRHHFNANACMRYEQEKSLTLVKVHQNTSCCDFHGMPFHPETQLQKLACVLFECAILTIPCCPSQLQTMSIFIFWLLNPNFLSSVSGAWIESLRVRTENSVGNRSPAATAVLFSFFFFSVWTHKKLAKR